MSTEVLIVGAGFSGAVVARQLAEAGISSKVIDRRSHVAGNCHTARDEHTGVMIHEYGPHIFNTDKKHVWDYVNRFAEFGPYVNRVKAVTSRGVFSLPVNLTTLNQFFGKSLSPTEAKAFLAEQGDSSIGEPANFEEAALKHLGRDLYETFFRGYTLKQWGTDPKEVPASVFARLPIRYTKDDNYYNVPYQGIPTQGYTALVEKLLDHERIHLRVNTDFTHDQIPEYRNVVYTGPIDAFFNYSEGRLGYRTVFWDKETGEGDIQGTAILNYPELQTPWTRKIEHKHFAPWEKHERSVLFTEYSKETGPDDEPYYPKRLAHDKEILARYQALAAQQDNVHFLGRLGTYRYLDMDDTIAEALAFSQEFVIRSSRS